VTETYGTSQASPAAPGAPHDTFSSTINERDGSESVMNCNTSISTPSTPERDSANTTNTNTALCIHNTNTTLKKKRYNVYVSEFHWKLALQKSKELGYSLSELINAFIISIVEQAPQFPSRTPLNFNIAIAKAESKPFINVGEYVAMKDLEELMLKVKRLRERADHKAQLSDIPMTFAIEQAKKLEESIKKALKGVKLLPPEKLQEVEAALQILRSIREGKQ
jgi:hypothetical protein